MKDGCDISCEELVAMISKIRDKYQIKKETASICYDDLVGSYHWVKSNIYYMKQHLSFDDIEDISLESIKADLAYVKTEFAEAKKYFTEVKEDLIEIEKDLAEIGVDIVEAEKAIEVEK